MSEALLTSIIQQSLDRIRQRLLDLSKRNQLLSYKNKTRTVHIINTPIEKIFDKLVLEGKSMTLIPESNPAVQNDNPEQPSSTTKFKKSSDTLLPTAHTEEKLERRCRKLAQEARIAIEETGSNLLYLAVGFLEWYENNQSNLSTQAPLILIPVKLERTHLSRMTTYSYLLSYRDEDIETNISLAEKLANDFQLKLPEFSYETEPESYLKEVAQLVEKMPRWQVLPELRLDFFSFTKLLMYKDLEDSFWPDDAKLSNNINLKQILVGKESADSSGKIYGEEVNIDTDPLAEKTPLVLDADSSQQTVIIEALWKQANLVIEGPPGTGKSQTITNLIAAALSQNKSILFVAEKKAALDVVRTRLDKIGLGEFCLELHSYKTQKGELHADLKRRLDKEYCHIEQLERDIQELAAQKQQLLAYSHLLNTIVGPNEERIYEIFGKVERLRVELASEPLRLEFNNPFQLTREEFNAKVNKLKELGGLYQTLSEEVIQYWQGFKPTQIWPGDEGIIGEILSTLLLETQNYQAYFDTLREEAQIPIEPHLAALQTLTQVDAT